jgi:hypothetical protein
LATRGPHEAQYLSYRAAAQICRPGRFWPASWSAAGEGMGPLRAGWGAAQGWARVHSAPSGQLHAHTPPPLRHHLLAHYPNRKVYVSDSSCTLLESTTYRF